MVYPAPSHVAGVSQYRESGGRQSVPFEHLSDFSGAARLRYKGGADSYLDSALRRQPQPPPAFVYRIVDGPAALPEGL